MSGIVGTIINALLPNANQSFATQPVGPQGLSFYQLGLRAPGTRSIIPTLTYTFSLAPQNITVTGTNLNPIFDTGGPAASGGVNREADLFGQSPAIYTISGTTGYKLKNTDGYLFNGLQSVANLQNIINQFNIRNQQIAQNGGTEFYTLEYYDYYRNDFQQFVPIGKPKISQSTQNPLMVFYELTFAAIQPVSSPLPVFLVDLIGKTIGTAPIAILGAIGNIIDSVNQSYNPVPEG